jgi:hypothetical protein
MAERAEGERGETRDVEMPSAAVPAIGVDRVRWGPILAGVAVALATLLVLTVLGLTIGLAAFEPNDVGTSTFGMASAIWGIVSALVAFMLGGWFAAYTAGVTGSGNGLLNGVMVGVAAIVLMLWFVGAGVGNLLGAVAGNLGSVMSVGQQVAGNANVTTMFDQARENSWISLAGLVAALVASAIGGWVGHRERENLFVPMRADGEDRRAVYAR